MPRRRLLLAVLALLSLAVPAAARAGDRQLSVMMDDDNLIYRDDATRDATLRRMKELGVDEVRVTLLWRVVADGARATPALDQRFRKLGADNPKAYPKLNWDRYDRLVRAGRTLGIGVYFDVTGPGPAWGHETAPPSHRRDQRTWKPKPREFKLFVEAVGKRYSGAYHDENDGRVVIPRVSFWSLWNEPNQGGWLTPQWSGGRPYSPTLYRRLYVAGHAALVATGHGGDTILIGETAPLGLSLRTSRSPMYPGVFMRALFCIDAAGSPTNGPGCSDFSRTGPLAASGWAHHPYTKLLAPYQPDPNPNAITMANLRALTGILDQAAANTARIPANLPIALTEFGYESNPPEPYFGVPLDRQALYLELGDLLAWLNPRVITQTQFLLRDVAPLRHHKTGSKAYWSTYQSGLFFANGVPKPAAAAYRMPFLASTQSADPATGGPSVGYWGQLRFRPKGAPDQVTLQYLPADGSTGWVPLGDPIAVASPRNFYSGSVTAPGPGQIRAVWGSPPFEVDSLPSPVAAPAAPAPAPAAPAPAPAPAR
jgi:hypothetical protein